MGVPWILKDWIDPKTPDPWSVSPFHNWNYWAIIACASVAVYGLFVSKIIKSLNTLVKIIVSSAGIVVTTLLNLIIFNVKGGWMVYLGLGTVVIAVFLFGYGGWLEKQEAKMVEEL